MSQQTIKQRARRQALDMAARRRRERTEREKRLQDLVVQVLTALGERDVAIAATEKRAGAALRQMTEVEGLTLREAVQWCGEEIPVREATRLRHLTDDEADDHEQPEPGDPDSVDTDSVDTDSVDAAEQMVGARAGTAAG
jgi:hypothetical protein